MDKIHEGCKFGINYDSEIISPDGCQITFHVTKLSTKWEREEQIKRIEKAKIALRNERDVVRFKINWN